MDDVQHVEQVDINETDEYGFTALHMAAENGHLKIAEELVAAGAKLDALVFDRFVIYSSSSLLIHPLILSSGCDDPLQLPDAPAYGHQQEPHAHSQAAY